MVDISRHIRQTFTTLLGDESVGFNATLASISNVYGIAPFTINFDASTSTNFYQGFYGAKDLIETTNFKFPVICLYTIQSRNQNLEKFATFAGDITVGIDTYLSFQKSSAIGNTEDYTDVVESTFFTIFNTAANYTFFGDVGYNGDISIVRGPLAKGAYNWLQLIQTRINVDLIAN